MKKPDSIQSINYIAAFMIGLLFLSVSWYSAKVLSGVFAFCLPPSLAMAINRKLIYAVVRKRFLGILLIFVYAYSSYFASALIESFNHPSLNLIQRIMLSLFMPIGGMIWTFLWSIPGLLALGLLFNWLIRRYDEKLNKSPTTSI
jgi:hypothetical protein